MNTENLNDLYAAADAGDVAACNKLGDQLYNDGNIGDAMQYYGKAALKDDADALYNLAYCHIYEDYDKNPALGVRLMQSAADKNHAKACRLIGFFYFYGEQTLPEDFDKSFYYMKKGADLGDATAQAHIGQCYEGGMWGVEKEDHALARYYYDLALKQNNEHAQWCVGMNYMIGKCGYPQNDEQAFKYFKMSADNGSSKGQLAVAVRYWNGEGTAKNPRMSLSYMEKAAEQGNVEAMSRFGQALFFGIECDITDANLARGREFLKKAAARGDKEAKEILEELADIERLNGPISVAKMKKETTGSSSGSSSGSSRGSSGGCYVATAIYGSYDCPQVWTLRRFRDNTLAETWYGRAFIHTYYAISPTLVKWFGKTEWFKHLWKPCLDRMVERLNGEGVDSTPYEDRIW